MFEYIPLQPVAIPGPYRGLGRRVSRARYLRAGLPLPLPPWGWTYRREAATSRAILVPCWLAWVLQCWDWRWRIFDRLMALGFWRMTVDGGYYWQDGRWTWCWWRTRKARTDAILALAGPEAPDTARIVFRLSRLSWWDALGWWIERTARRFATDVDAGAWR